MLLFRLNRASRLKGDKVTFEFQLPMIRSKQHWTIEGCEFPVLFINVLFLWVKLRVDFEKVVWSRRHIYVYFYHTSSRSARKTAKFNSPSQTATGRRIHQQNCEQRLSDEPDSGGTLPGSRTSVRTSSPRDSLPHATRNRHLTVLFHSRRDLWVGRAPTVYFCKMGEEHSFVCKPTVPRSSNPAWRRLEGTLHHGRCTMEHASRSSTATSCCWDARG